MKGDPSSQGSPPLWIHHVLSCAWVNLLFLTHLVSRAVLWLSMNVFGPLEQIGLEEPGRGRGSEMC